MNIKLFLNKDINYNANFYFEKAKKLKSKIPGILKTIEKTEIEIQNLQKNKDSYIQKKEENDFIEKNIKKKWYEKKFRHTFTKNNFLFVIGKDSSSNESLIKKHLEKDDLVFHSETFGSPFGILKNSKNKANEIDLKQAGQFLLCFSNLWKSNFGIGDVFFVDENQISKKADTKTFLEKGSFMIKGEKNFIKNLELKIGIGFYFEKIKKEENEIKQKIILSGSPNFIKEKCFLYLFLIPGNDNFKKLNNQIKKKFKFQIDELSHFIPNNSKILKLK